MTTHPVSSHTADETDPEMDDFLRLLRSLADVSPELRAYMQDYRMRHEEPSLSAPRQVSRAA